ncbi:MAG: hypothetical protein U0Q21_08650 [Dermatophilaceae bacterium]
MNNSATTTGEDFWTGRTVPPSADADTRAETDVVRVWTQAVAFLTRAIAPTAADAGRLSVLHAVGSATLAVVARSPRIRTFDPGDGRLVGDLALALSTAPEVPPAPEADLVEDALHAGREAIIASVRRLVTATKIGHALPRLPRPVPQLLADAEAMLGDAVARRDHELTAALLTVWPLLGGAWSATARCALDRLLAAHAAYGFLPPVDGPVAPVGDDVLRAGGAATGALALLLTLLLEHSALPQPWSATDTDLTVARMLAQDAGVVDATLAVSSALRTASRAGDRVGVLAILELALSAGVEAESAIAAAVEVVAGHGPFAVRAA